MFPTSDRSRPAPLLAICSEICIITDLLCLYQTAITYLSNSSSVLTYHFLVKITNNTEVHCYDAKYLTEDLIIIDCSQNISKQVNLFFCYSISGDKIVQEEEQTTTQGCNTAPETIRGLIIHSISSNIFTVRYIGWNAYSDPNQGYVEVYYQFFNMNSGWLHSPGLKATISRRTLLRTSLRLPLLKGFIMSKLLFWTELEGSFG